MLKNFAEVLGRMLDRKIVGALLLLALFVLWCPWRGIPDYLNLNSITAKKDVVFKLLTTLIGSSSIMLTLLLVGYNFYVKTTRRFTLEFVSENRWLKLLLSLFFGVSIYLAMGFCFVETSNNVNDITFLYLAYTLTVLFLLALFPMALLTLNESNSLDNIHRILNKVTGADIDRLYEARFGELTFAGLEKNPLLVLRDLCISAIIEKDHSIPETVLTKLYNRLIVPLNKDSAAEEIHKALYIWALFASHLKREVIKQDDIATGDRLLSLSLSVHHHLAEHRIVHIRGNALDHFLKDYLRLIIEQNVFNELQADVAASLIKMIESHYLALHYSDDEIVTAGYCMAVENPKGKLFDSESALEALWLYIEYDLPDIFTETMVHAMVAGRKAVYQDGFSGLHELMNTVFHAEGLSIYQKEELTRHLLTKSRDLSEFAIAHQVWERIHPVSDVQIQLWFDSNIALAWDGLFVFVRMIRQLRDHNADFGWYLEHLFTLGRALSRRTLTPGLLNQAVEYIVKTALDLINDERTSVSSRKFVLGQLRWYQVGFLQVHPVLVPVKSKYDPVIMAILARFEHETIVEESQL